MCNNYLHHVWHCAMYMVARKSLTVAPVLQLVCSEVEPVQQKNIQKLMCIYMYVDS